MGDAQERLSKMVEGDGEGQLGARGSGDNS